MKSTDSTAVHIAGATTSLEQKENKPFFSGFAPNELRDLVFRAAIDSLQVRGYIADPDIEKMFPTEVALRILDRYTPDDALQNILHQIEAEKAEAGNRKKAGEPHPMRTDEIATLSPKACMDIMCGLFFLSGCLDEDEVGCMLNAGLLVAEVYGKWDEET